MKYHANRRKTVPIAFSGTSSAASIYRKLSCDSDVKENSLSWICVRWKHLVVFYLTARREMDFIQFHWFRKVLTSRLHSRNCLSLFAHGFCNCQANSSGLQNAFQSCASSIYFVRKDTGLCSFATLALPSTNRLRPTSAHSRNKPLQGLLQY